jgi:hypothetical protein
MVRNAGASTKFLGECVEMAVEFDVRLTLVRNPLLQKSHAQPDSP